MRTVVVYPIPLESPEVWALFKPFVDRFSQSLRQFDPGCDYTLSLVLNRPMPEATPPEWINEIEMMFKGLPYRTINYEGGGCDIGSFQHCAAQQVENVFMVCCVTRVFAWQAGWLKRLVEAREKFGAGLFGTSASLEGGSFHVCCRCYCMDSDDFKRYPHKIESRDQGVFFEIGEGNLAEWFFGQNSQVHVVYWDAICGGGETSIPQDFFTPPNIFRRGDQSNLLVKDKHSQAYENASPEEKRRLEKMCFEAKE
jgi:hypothetical protein